MKLKGIVFIIILLLDACLLFAQQDIQVDKRTFNIEDQGFKEAWANIKSGDKLYKGGIGTYTEALKNYNLAAAYNNFNSELNYKMGVCCLFSEKKEDALHHFKKAYELNADVAEDIHLMLGRGYHYTHNFEEAIQEYRNHLKSLSEKEKKKSKAEIEKLIEECENGKILLQNPVSVAITNIGNTINSPHDEYNPLLTGSGNLMYFTSRRPGIRDTRRNFYDNKYDEDIYISYFRNNQWEPAQNVGKSVNTEYNDAALTIADEDKKLYIYYGTKKNGDIYVSEFKREKWSKPKQFSGKFNSKARETTISFSIDGNYLYFVSTGKKESLGGSDIYMSRKNDKDRWEKPVNLGPVINTPYDEEAVFVYPDGKTLYFCSRGHNSMGGFDIFQSTMIGENEWSPPENLGFPINSAEDDLFYHSYSDSLAAYFCSVREDSYGLKDIYMISYLPEIEYPDVLEEALEYPEYEPVILTFGDEVPLLEKDESILLRGTVRDSEDSSAVMARLEIIDMELNDIIATTLSDKNTGSYSIRLEVKKNYGVEITSQGYMLFLDIIEIHPETKDSETLKDFVLEKVKVGEKVILKNIFFELSKSVLTTASYEELNRVVKLLESNPTIRIEISGHTDNTGSYQINQRLSEARAKAVMDYLVLNGINANRLEYAGYAYSQPVATNDTPEGRARNRRVEFKILSK